MAKRLEFEVATWACLHRHIWRSVLLDLQAFQDQVKGAGGPRTFCDDTPGDFFAGLNVTGIVLEVPSDWLHNEDGDTNIGVWAETWGPRGRIHQRARPGIATVLIADGSENDFNKTISQHQLRKFGDEVASTLAPSAARPSLYNAHASVSKAPRSWRSAKSARANSTPTSIPPKMQMLECWWNACISDRSGSAVQVRSMEQAATAAPGTRGAILWRDSGCADAWVSDDTSRS